MVEEFLISLLDFRKHLVESIGKFSEVIVRALDCTGAVVLSGRNQPGHRCQMRDWLKDRALEPGEEQHGQ